MPLNGKIIIVSYTFPPFPGIGGRRWVKFAKELYRSGIPIKVFAGKLEESKESEWIKDLAEIKEFVTYIDPGMVKWIANPPKTIIEKLRYKLALFFIKNVTLGNFYDRSLFWANKVVNKVRKELNFEDVHCVIATGAPFKYLFDIAQLKVEYPKIKFIADIRDPWTYTPSNGWDRLSLVQQQTELRYEKYVIENFDSIITVTPGIISTLKKRYPKVKRISLIENGFDIDDLFIQPKIGTESNTMRFIFAGTFYPNANEYLNVFVSGLKEYLATRKDNSISIEVDFYGKIDGNFKGYINGISCIRHHGSISLAEVHEKIQLADYGLLFLSQEINYSISTKFCEYILYDKPLIVFGPHGYTMDFVEINELGWAVETKSSWVRLLQELAAMKANNVSKVISRDAIEHLNVENITDRLIKLIRDIDVN